MLYGMRRRLSFANVTSVLALTVALGGTSYAAVTLPRNSVTSTQIKRGTIVGSDIHANAVTGAKVKDRSLKASDFASGQLPAGAKGDAGPQGPQGPQGSRGDTGTVGAATVQFAQAAADLLDTRNQSYSVFCPDGQQAIAGGGRGDDTLSEETILTNTRPAISRTNTEPPRNGQGFTGWRITVVNPTGGSPSGIRPEVWVVCVAAPTP
jgi:hypothetical protein